MHNILDRVNKIYTPTEDKNNFNPNDVSSLKINNMPLKEYNRLLEETVTKTERLSMETSNIQIPKIEQSQLSQMYQDWGAGKIDLSAIKQYKNEQARVKNEVEATGNNYSKWTNIVRQFYAYLDVIKAKMNAIKKEINNTATSQNKLTSFFNDFCSKVKQAVSNTKGISKNLKELPKITNKINFNGLNKGMKKGIGHVFRYAGALLSLESIYGLLSSSANAWLSSQNAGAQQLNANIEYMKYAMGSALAPVIQFVTNLVYQLMKTVQSVVYALTGVNIFANAGAKAYSNMANSAKKASKESKQLAGVHDEINNIQETNPEGGGSGAGSIRPNFDLSEVEGITSNIIDAIKNGNWYEVGEILGNKLNEAMNNIDWGN